jgi:outer membrane protein assembly factor BamB
MVLIVATVLPVVGTANITISGSEENSANNKEISYVCEEVDWWSECNHDPSNTGHSTSTGPSSNHLFWNAETSRLAGLSPVVDENKVYICSYENIYCYDANDGGLIWSKPIGAACTAVVNDRVYVPSTDRIYCLNATDGSPIWEHPIIGYGGDPTVVDDKIFLGSFDGDRLDDGRVYCLNTSDGNPVWTFEIGAHLGVSLAVADDKVYFGSWDKKIYCLNATNGEHIWNYTTDFVVYSSPSFYEGKIYIQNSIGYLFCLDANNGSELWIYDQAMFTGDCAPAVADGKIFCGFLDMNGTTPYCGILCLNADDGSEIWFSPTGYYYPGASPAIADGKVYVETYDVISSRPINGFAEENYGRPMQGFSVVNTRFHIGSNDENSNLNRGGGKVFCVNATDGSLIWEYSVVEEALSCAAVADGKVYIGAGYFESWAKVYCFGESSDLQIEIKGGLGLTAVVTNTGKDDLTDVDVGITFDGGIVLPREKTTIISTLASGASAELRAFVLGIGKPTITVTVECTGGVSKELIAHGFVFLFFIFLYDDSNTMGSVQIKNVHDILGHPRE